MTAWLECGPHVLSSKHELLIHSNWQWLQMVFQCNKCSDWVKMYYGSLGCEWRVREAALTAPHNCWVEGRDRTEVAPCKQRSALFDNSSEVSLQSLPFCWCCLYLRHVGEPDVNRVSLSLLNNYASQPVVITELTHTHWPRPVSLINVAPGFLLAADGRRDLVGWLCLVTVNAPLLAKIIYAQD